MSLFKGSVSEFMALPQIDRTLVIRCGETSPWCLDFPHLVFKSSALSLDAINTATNCKWGVWPTEPLYGENCQLYTGINHIPGCDYSPDTFGLWAHSSNQELVKDYVANPTEGFDVFLPLNTKVQILELLNQTEIDFDYWYAWMFAFRSICTSGGLFVIPLMPNKTEMLFLSSEEETNQLELVKQFLNQQEIETYTLREWSKTDEIRIQKPLVEGLFGMPHDSLLDFGKIKGFH